MNGWQGLATMNSDIVFIEKVPHEKGFAEHFEKYVKPKLLEIESTRLLERRIVLIHATLASLGVAVVLVAAVASGFHGWVISGSLIIGGFIITWLFKPGKEYKTKKKEIIIPEILKFVGDFTYRPIGHIPSNILISSRLFEKWDKYEGEDRIAGKYFDRTFQFVEAELAKKGGESDTTIFKGFIFALELSWNSGQQTVAITKEHKLWKWLSSRFKDLQKVEFDDSAFQERFDVYSNLPDKARRIISSPLIEDILQLGRLMETDQIEFFLGDQSFVLALATKRDLFDPVSVHKTALTTDDSRRFLEEIHEILEIVATLANITASDGSAPEASPPNRPT